MSRFKGRDFQTLRSEMIDYIKARIPTGWDSDNVSDPMVVMVDSIAQMGDQLEYYIDMMRREADMSTALLQSSIYSYALREGYQLLLPRGARLTPSFYSATAQILDIPKFGELKIKGGPVLYAVQDYHLILGGPEDGYQKYQSATFVLGEKATVDFNFGSIDRYSRILLPTSYIDGELTTLEVSNDDGLTYTEWNQVSDVVSSGLTGTEYSLTPTFDYGNARLYIEFPVNYRNLFTSSAKFRFTYLRISNQNINLPFELDLGNDEIQYVLGNGVAGYRDYESPSQVKANYKNYVKDYSALLTLDDYRAYLRYQHGLQFKAYDIKSSEYYHEIDSNLNVRSLYVIIDLLKSSRQLLQEDLESRSSRSDLIYIVPVGYAPYTIGVYIDADLLGTTETAIQTIVIQTLMEAYAGDSWVDPVDSKVIQQIHDSSEYINRVSVQFFEGFVDPSQLPDDNGWNTSTDSLYNRFWGLTTYFSDRIHTPLGFGYGDQFRSWKTPLQTVMPNYVLSSLDTAYQLHHDYDKFNDDDTEFNGVSEPEWSESVYDDIVSSATISHKFWIHKLANVFVVVE